jgi:hypothetical protein
MNDLIKMGVLANNRFLSKTNPVIKAALADGGTSTDSTYIQRCARQIEDMGYWDNLVGWWVTKLAKIRNSGGVDYIPKLYDLSGNGNHGVQTVEAYQPMLDTNGAKFDGINDQTESDILNCLLSHNDHTITFWFKTPYYSGAPPYDIGKYAKILEQIKYSSSPYPRLSIPFDRYNKRIYYNRYNGSTQNYNFIAIENNTDTFIVFTYKGNITTSKGYYNGSLVNTTTSSIDVQASHEGFFLAGYNNLGQFTIDDIRVYDMVLSDTEITAIYNLTKGRYGL